ncbi:MAG: alpha-galactosidase [Pseudomonadales bacterium]
MRSPDDAPTLWRIGAADVELCLVAGAGHPPALVHLGRALGDVVSAASFVDGASAGGLIDAPQATPLWPDPARGWTGPPGCADADPGEPWHWDPPVVDAPALRVCYRHGDERRLTCRLQVGAEGVVTMQFEAVGCNDARLSYTVPLPAQATEAIGFTGRWAGELQAQRLPLGGGWYQSSRAGSRTAHDAFPGFVAGSAGFGEDQGEVLALHLAWSGNYELRVVRSREGRHLLQVILAAAELERGDDGGVLLPALHVAWSDKGLNGIRCRFQDAARRLRQQQGSATDARVQLNTWEGVYFEHDQPRLMAMASVAARLGVERFVLDDGWFGRRSDDTRGLGDWTPRPEAYPEGLGPLMDHVNREGLDFGLWVEPEMVSADSALFAAHPDWILGSADQPLGRHQFALDLTQPACFAHLRQTLAGLVSDTRIASLKWDMNRDVPQAAGRALAPAARALIESVREARPGLEVEACASGGGRADWSALAWCNRVWLSDAHDPDVRLPMMAAYGLFAPPEVMGSHVGPRTSHQTGRRWSLHARAAMAVLGSLGLELDPLSLGDDERDTLRDYISLHRKHRPWLHDGHLLVLPHPDPALCAVGVFARERDRALLCLLQRAPRLDPVPAPLRIGHLRGAVSVRAPLRDPAIDIGAPRQPGWVRGMALHTHGEVLAEIGLALPILAPLRAVLVEIVSADAVSPAQSTS